MVEPVMTILISYDKFTQCNKDLAEHHFANCVLKLCNHTSWASSEFQKICKGNWKMKLCRKLWGLVFFKDIDDLGSQNIGKYVLRILTSWHVSASPMESRGFSAALPSGWNACWVFGRSGVPFHTLIIFLGHIISLFCACHCCFCSVWVYSHIFHFNPCLGTSVMRWCPCCRTEALSSPCLLAALPQGQCTDLATEGKRKRAVNNLKCICTSVFSGSPPFVETVQQQTDILP